MGIPQDDRTLPFTRIIAAIIILVLLAAFISLYIFPTHTDIDFAWTILPPTTALLIGAGYTAGAYFFARLLIDRQWHRVQVGFLPITLFTLIMLVDTLLHWSRFHQGTFIFFVWTAVYLLTPLLVPFIWWRNRLTALSGLETRDLRFTGLVRWGLTGLAFLGVIACLGVLVFPSLLISIAPWKLTELTARILSGWGLLSSATLISIAADGRWSAARTMLQSALVGLTLTTLALPRMWPDFNPTNPLTYLFAGGIGFSLVLLAVTHFLVERSLPGS